MKKDNLEQYIRDNRSKFDVETPPLKAWYQIEKELEQAERKANRFQIWKITRLAAAVVLLLVAGGLIGSFLTNRTNNATTNFAEIEKIAPELQETEHYYRQEFNQKLQLLAAYKDQSPQVIKDLAESDEFIKELKSELLAAPKGSEEIVINNIIKTYQIKLEILESVLENLEQSQIQKQQTNETNI